MTGQDRIALVTGATSGIDAAVVNSLRVSGARADLWLGDLRTAAVAYCASKGAVVQNTRAVALDHAHELA